MAPGRRIGARRPRHLRVGRVGQGIAAVLEFRGAQGCRRLSRRRRRPSAAHRSRFGRRQRSARGGHPRGHPGGDRRVAGHGRSRRRLGGQEYRPHVLRSVAGQAVRDHLRPRRRRRSGGHLVPSCPLRRGGRRRTAGRRRRGSGRTRRRDGRARSHAGAGGIGPAAPHARATAGPGGVGAAGHVPVAGVQEDAPGPAPDRRPRRGPGAGPGGPRRRDQAGRLPGRAHGHPL